MVLSLAEHGLVGQFTGLWPSPKEIEGWVQRNWRPLLSQGIRSHFIGRGYYIFVFYSRDDRDLIFCNSSYFMGPRGLYLNKWSPDFDPTQDIQSAVPVWVRLPHFPLHCWSSESLEAIGNKLRKYINRAERKDQFSCARICVEVDLEIGLHEAINLTVADWSYIQELDYEQIPFKCRFCHDYDHFAKNCKKGTKDDLEKEKPQWTQIQKMGQSNQTKRKIGNEGKVKNGIHAEGKNVQVAETIMTSNKFVVLSTSEDLVILEYEEL